MHKNSQPTSSSVSSTYARPVYLVDMARTPFLKASPPTPGSYAASDLAVSAARALLLRHNCRAENLDQVILGCVMPAATEANIARLVALRLGCGHAVVAWTVQRNCASGMQAIDSAAQAIASGQSDLVLAGGTEAMSQAPLTWNRRARAWLGQWLQAQRKGGRLSCLAQWRPSMLMPEFALKSGLTDQYVGMSMPQTAEYLAHQFQINREDMDAYAVLSQQRAHAATQAGHFAQDYVPLLTPQGQVVESDQGIRADSSIEQLAKLKPILHSKFGMVTAGNSSQITDGAAMLLLASEDAVRQYDLPVVARVCDVAWAGVDPKQMGIGPVAAAQLLLTRQQMPIETIDYWEINEAFAGQVLACCAGFSAPEYCQQQHFPTDGPYTEIPLERLNIDGGAIALGHPVGASGARIVGQLARILKRQQAAYGIASICIGGGQGGALLLQALSDPL